MTVIINTKAPKELKQAVRIAAINNGFTNSSEFIRNILSSNNLISNEMRKIQKKSKK